MGKLQRHDRPSTQGQNCNWPGCTGAGEFKAPRSRSTLREYFWFCLDHVREYNRNWNYYEGMDESEVEADIRRDTVWDRPTWKLGTGKSFAAATAAFDDPLGVGDAARDADARAAAQNAAAYKVDRKVAQALAVFSLDLPLAMEDLKARYKELVKRHHPDANGGNKAAEEEFKRVIQAYDTLLGFLNP